MDKKEPFLVNLEQFEHEIPLNSMQIKVFGVRKCTKNSNKALCVGTTQNKCLE